MKRGVSAALLALGLLWSTHQNRSLAVAARKDVAAEKRFGVTSAYSEPRPQGSGHWRTAA